MNSYIGALLFQRRWVVGNGMRQQALEKQSIMVNMVVCPWELGRESTKSVAIWDQGRWSILLWSESMETDANPELLLL